ncbi:MAG TPA: cellulase family glycosylhydrolase [Micromonosporaceae bacterium]|nr:cellulase family glycosylhydrolase [Micromonosporaceae bacterium]
MDEPQTAKVAPPRRRRLARVLLAAAVAAPAVIFAAMNLSPASAAPTVFRGVAANRCLDVPNAATTNGAQLVLWDCTGSANQTFNNTSSRQLQVYGNKCLDAFGGGTAPGTPVIIWDCTGAANQQWNINSNGTITNVHNGLCLDVFGGGTANGSQVILWTCTGADNQRWARSAGSGSSSGGGGGTVTGPPPATGSTPVARHGQLRVCGTRMCDRTGAGVQLRGVSSMWLNWDPAGYGENLTALRWMRDNWNLTVIRAAMGVEPSGAYLSDPARARGQVERIINNAVAAGVYVIVDWHAHEAQNHRAQSVAFFTDLARRYGHLPNVIWEPYNEPLQVSWASVIKPYHQAVVNAIRSVDPDNIIILGTPTWSQNVDQAAADRVSGSNLMYTLHFYSCSHTQWLRDRADAAIRSGIALFVTEWGGTHADGGLDGRVCAPETQAWLNWMRTNGVGWTAWKLVPGTDSSNLLRAGAPVTGGWNGYLNGHASLVVAGMR